MMNSKRSMRCSTSSSHAERGQAALITVLVTMAVMLVFALGIGGVSFTNLSIVRNIVRSSQSYYLAEAGIEDTLLRITHPEMTYQNSNTLTLGGHTTTITVTQNGSDYTVTSKGDVNDRFRTASTTIHEDVAGASFFYGIQVDDGGLSMGNDARVNGNVFSNGNIVGSSGTVITNDATVSGGLEDTPAVEWTAHDSDQFFATASTNRDIAQSFTATSSGTLPQVSVYLGKVGNPTSNLTVRVTNDNSGKPATSSLASATIPYTIVNTTPAWIDVAFSSPTNVTNSNKYWIVLDYGSNSASNYWNWRKDSTGGYPNNTGSYTSNWSSGSAVWTSVHGDLAFRAWIGGTSKRIEGVTIGDASTGTGRANLFVSTTIHGSSCPNQYCIVENRPREELPIPTETIAAWKNEAEAGGTYAGSYTLTNNASATIGPLKITGDLDISNEATLTLTGTVWVQGDIQLSNDCTVQLDAGYGQHSGVLVTDSNVQVSNDCVFYGSGEEGSYMMLLSDRNATGENVMTISNDSIGVIYYASRGRLHLSNDAAAKEATAYGITLDNDATITYESGLQDITFTSGPSGGWEIRSWQEVE